jgi:hypothetical protein
VRCSNGGPSNAHATTASDTAAQHPIRCAQHSAGNAHPRHASYIARMTQPRYSTFSQAQRAPCRTCRLAPRSTHHHTTHARRHTRHDKPRPPERHASIIMARVTPKTAHANKHAPHIAHTHHTNRAPHARTTSRTAATTVHCANITAHTPPHARHTQRGTQLHTPHTPPPENHTSHPRGLRATGALTSELPGCPESTGCCRRAGCCTSPSTCRTHEQPPRHTMAPDATADPSQPHATHRSA